MSSTLGFMKNVHKKQDSLAVKITSPDPAINYSEYVSQGNGLDSVARCNPDGRISLTFDFKNDAPQDLAQPRHNTHEFEEFAVETGEWTACPAMSIVIMIVGSRGDVQPYVALGKELLKDGHRIRIATHETFRDFVTGEGLEFYNIGGNPQDLMSYMVKNPGLIPGLESLTNGDIVRKRKMLAEMINGSWHACHSPCQKTGRAFAADAIISNPPTFAHIHCAEALGIPLLLTFTMPWTPTAAFAHPLVNITSNASFGMSNYLSYAAADLLTWQGIGDIVNTFRTENLGLSGLSIRSGPGYVDRLKVPWTYCMSPALVPKPDDWKNNIDVTGFYFLDLANAYKPPADLIAFLDAGDPPVYIGFGSVVVDDPEELTQTIYEATEQAGVRAVVSSGWGGLGGGAVPPHIFILGNIPHDWLFDQSRVSAVVHHGGAGTTAIGLAKGRPTVVVPFFGDQGFWGSMIYKAGAGPKPIPQKELSVSKLTEALKYAISPIAKTAAAQLAERIHHENGVRSGVESFYKHLPLLNMRCDLDPTRIAVWWSNDQCLKLSAFAAQTLADAKLLSMRHLVLHRPKEYRPRKKLTEQSSGDKAGNMFWNLTHHGILGDHSPSTPTSETGHHRSPSFGKCIMDAFNTIHAGLQGPDEVAEKQHKSGAATPETGKPAHKGHRRKESIIEMIKNLMHPKRPASQAHVTIPLQGAWTLLETPSGKTSYKRQRLTRIAEGRQAVRRSSEAERSKIIQLYQAATTTTPQRVKMYEEAWEAKVERSHSNDRPCSPKTPRSIVFDEKSPLPSPLSISIDKGGAASMNGFLSPVPLSAQT
ncbi:hypothetical protein D9619_012250 [Psilocybe cf. subviscida]|uniref:Glycosyltransferase family 28 N-terminal domain-containing protein n=1 Tax=Psilocybe cf. subviscida TaxID=2480587 RepID=A0A8H5EZJ4_9AGAR|nr:hypothetical protein D9619_012250 [Psilocybe cf. subviscida]